MKPNENSVGNMLSDFLNQILAPAHVKSMRISNNHLLGDFVTESKHSIVRGYLPHPGPNTTLNVLAHEQGIPCVPRPSEGVCELPKRHNNGVSSSVRQECSCIKAKVAAKMAHDWLKACSPRSRTMFQPLIGLC